MFEGISTYSIIFFGLLFILIFRLTTFFILSFIYTFSPLIKKKRRIDKFLKMSIIIPAYNEEITIANCIKSILALNYPNYEVIVIDDGSTDNTFKEASAVAQEAKVIRQRNGGKPDAINTGIKNATGDVIITVDADSKLHPDALMWINRRFSNPRLGAVAGNVKIDNPVGILKSLQSLEYSTGLNLARKSLSLLHCVTIVPGAIAALKTDVLREVGGFPIDTYAEDFDITMKIMEAGYYVEYEAHALAFTQAPKTLEDFMKQRRRWYRGMIQVLSKYRQMYFNPKCGTAGMIGVPYMWFEVGSSLVNILLFTVVVSIGFFLGDMGSIAWGMAVYWILSTIVSTYAVIIDPKPSKREILISPLIPFYSIFIDGVRLMTLVEETLNITMTWEKPEREDLLPDM